MTDEQGCKALISRLTRRPFIAFDILFAANFPETIFYLAELNAEDYDANQAALTSTCGVSITLDRETRTYYGNNAMSHVAGHVGQITADQQAQYEALGYSAGDLIGQGGVERMFERALAGTPERTLRITEPGGVVLREFSSIGGSAPTPVQMTIDRELQLVVAQAMADAYDFAYPTWGSRRFPAMARRSYWMSKPAKSSRWSAFRCSTHCCSTRPRLSRRAASSRFSRSAPTRANRSSTMPHSHGIRRDRCTS
ncbi:MAG: hypothetical protein HND48_04690 [Chloroflexi bacterium]|nr:hypothetical protein [Chloroflexota bacterium]